METRRDVVEFGLRRWLIVLGVVLAPLMETIDSSIVNVALPTVEGNLGATLDQATWIVTGYLTANVIVIPLTPWLQSRFGRRQYFMTTIIGFTIASLLCGFSSSILQLVLCRIVQGLFGGGLIATAQAALRDLFPPEEVGTGQGVFAVVILVGPILAPVIGGALIDNASWQWIFFINLLPGIVSAAIVGTMLRNPEDPTVSPVDGLGVVFIALGLGGLQFMLDEGERHDWFSDGSIVAATAISVAGFAAFVWWELFGTRTPIVDLRVLRSRIVSVGVFLGAGIAATLFGTILMVPQYSQSILGFTAYDSGELMFFRAITVMLLAPVVAGLVGSGRLDARIVMATGYTLTAIGSVLVAWATTSDTSFGHLIPGLMIGGCGTAMLFIPLLITIQSTTSPQDAPKASAFITLAFQLGASVASALFVTMLDRRTQFHTDAIAGSMTLASPAAHALHSMTPAQLAGLVAAQATTLGFADVAYAVAALAVLLVPLVFLMARQPRDMSGGLALE
ncbi:MAG: DHA2 family efflux MFS transporter permease subunit [Candidatus Eremiobacteraeota bacterium]|nr:DHA2 family efflux MFS transporter permease subunit [Candidatus Eremiobacteraeota bacterium]